jgi:DNA-binding transcriptional LysR family regulator
LRVQAAISASRQKLEAFRSGKAGAVGIGVVSTGKYFAPAIVHAFSQAFPQIDIRLLIGNRDEIVRALEIRSIDLAIMGRPPETMAITHDYLGEHPFGIIAPPGHSLANMETTPAAKLLAQTFLLREPGSGTRVLAQRYLDQYGSGQGYKALDMNTNESIKQAVMAGMGIAMISLHTVIHELQENRLVCLKAPGLPLVRKWILVRPAKETLSGAAHSFQDFLLQRRQSFIPPAP